MPELPEVETIRRALEKRVLGRRIAGISISREDYVRAGLSDISSLTGQVIQSVERRGKILAMHLSGEWALIHHLGMTGRILCVTSKEEAPFHTHVRISLDGGGMELRQWDPRRFGYIAVLRECGLVEFAPWTSLGADPFDVAAGEFLELLSGRSQPIKTFLLDQRRIAGLGNIYADESLFRARVHPARPARSLRPVEAQKLRREMRRVLREAIAAGGSTTNDYQKLDGTLGEFQHKHRVYRKAGRPCRNCGAVIQRMILGGRSTHFCPECQPLRP
ncbi:MAG: bifunctional DNA-formamidopyrimidine glycosylase/DNA-(apurinic or apyrimidinic site) lyase [Candidatus Omnitrophica bacterium]|nr:bifunctional DNA-formamidopyrimidine glycosylase/DNA-(apurinic or apyrimidinic site) lyase [Candidatus Omnitrophota bacterium]